MKSNFRRYNPARLSEVAVSRRAAALGAFNAAGTKQRMPWRLNATGTIRLSGKQLPMPTLPSRKLDEKGEAKNDGNSVTLSAGAVLSRPPWSPSVIVEEAFVHVSFEYSTAKTVGESAAFWVKGKGKVKYPCLQGDQAYVTAEVGAEVQALTLA